MKRRNLVLAGILGVIIAMLMFGIAAASFDYLSESVRRSYSEGENLQGRIVISADEEAGDSEFTGDFDGGIGLLGLIRANNLSASSYSCSTPQCSPDFKINGGAITSINIGSSGKSIGFKASAGGIEMQSLSLNIEGSVGQSCSQQLSIDVLGNGEMILQSNKYSVPCGIKNYGCFDANADSENAMLSSDLLCENITLDAGPAYELGAKIKKGTDTAEISAVLLDKDENWLDSCILNLVGAVGSEIETSCIVNYSIAKSGKYLVCIQANVDVGGYYIKTETSGEKCGTSGRDYEIFARQMAFAANPKIEISENVAGQENLLSLVQAYADSKYGGTCPSNGCIIPIKISGQQQTVSFSSAKIAYSSIENSNIYLLEEKSPLITSGRIELEIKYANLSVGDIGSRNYSIYLNDERIVKIPINVAETFEFDITPKFVPLGINNLFLATTSENVTTGTWNFGDGTIETFSGKSATHRFTAEGEYTISVELVTSRGLRAARTFTIQTGDAETAVLTLTDRYTKRIANLTLRINTYPLWVASEIKSSVNLTLMSSSITKAKADLEGNISADKIVENLLALRVPYAIATSKTGSYPLAKGYEGIDINLAGAFYGKEIKNEEGMRQAAISWIGKNYDANIVVESITRYDDDGSSLIFNHYTLGLTPKGNPKEANLFINYPLNAIKFKENYGQKEAGSGSVIPLTGGNQGIEFIILQPIELSSLGIYLSPDVDELPYSGIGGPITEALAPYFEFNSVLFWIGLGVLAVLFLIIYIMIQEWFKKNIERGLFPNHDDLYNIITFIHNSRRKGMGDGEIRKNLEKSGWRKQQIDYAFEKLEGKRAMFEIPIFRAAEQKKIRQEIAKREIKARSEAPGVRFIKRQ